MNKKYQRFAYVGSEQILAETDLSIGGHKIVGLNDVKDWIKGRPEEMINGMITATFIINENEELIVHGRHTEHVMCAKGGKVLSAGEVIFEVDGKDIYISEISNQSTGYCPKPDSWAIVEIVLDKIKIDHPAYFTHAYEFRYCNKCFNINLIKDENYQCLVCNAELDSEWNFDK